MRAQLSQQSNEVKNTAPEVVKVPKKNNAVSEPTTTLGFWISLLILYLLWDVVVLKTKIKETVEPNNIRTNFYNLFLIGIASVIFINGFKVVLVKVAAWEIPILSWLANKLLPLFQL